VNVDAMLDLLNRGIPSAVEFIGFAESNGWGFYVKGDKAALKANPSDPVAVAFAKVLGREPYRSNVLAELNRIFAPAAEPDLPEALPDIIVVPAPAEHPPTQEQAEPHEHPELPGQVLASGEACPAGSTRVLVSEWGTHALRYQTLEPGTPIRWEAYKPESHPAAMPMPVYRLYLPTGLATLFRSKFHEAFPMADRST
jgi:hypothetical protein